MIQINSKVLCKLNNTLVQCTVTQLLGEELELNYNDQVFKKFYWEVIPEDKYNDKLFK